jgi:multicomponent K+:H+ antiporter subunit A
MTSALLGLALLAPFAAIPAVMAASRWGRPHAAWTAAAAMLVGLVLLAPLVPDVLAGRAIVATRDWLPEWGFNLSLRFDGLGLLFALLILGIGVLIVLYAAYYLPQADRLGRFFAFLLAFAGGMLGVVLSENVLLLLVFWEITSLTSFLLIAYKYEAHDARIAARMALAVTGGGGLALFAGLLVLGHIAGSFELTDILARGDQIRSHPLYWLALVLILLGAFTKSAQFPFHFWLPNAMAAPTPVSAYLHSATMVKAGVFLIARFYPVLAGTDLWFILVSGTGAVTFVYGAYVALLKHDFKGLLAFSTVSHLGLITLLFGLSTPLSAVAGVFHIINHAIFKASLFMSAGIIDHECGTRDMRRINGLFKYMPRTAILGIIAAGSMAGVPLLNGFLSKEMFFAEAVEFAVFEPFSWVLPLFAVIAGALAVAYSIRFVHDVFFNGEPIDLPRTPHEPPRWMRFPVELLVVLCVLVGVAPQFSVGALLNAAALSVLPGGLPYFTLAVWHGFDLALLMSFVAMVAGTIYYFNRRRIYALQERYRLWIQSPVAFERTYRWVTQRAERIMAYCDNGSLQRYLALFVGLALVLGGWAYISGPDASPGGPVGSLLDPVALAGLVALVIGSLGTALYHRRRLVAIVFMSVVGLIVSLTFVRFSAPDLALTQLSVEVVTIVLLLLALRYLPAVGAEALPRARNVGHITLAVVGGAGVAALCYAMLTRPFETISGYFLANAVPGGGGSNVVNVILVDFRGFDTLGEITVLAMAALGAHALLRGLRLSPYPDATSREADRRPVMLAMLVRPLLPLALVVSLYILLRGHNLPGGGFIAGLTTAVALILQYVARGIDFARERLPIDSVRMLALGLALATLTGIASWLFGAPFLTSAYRYVALPLIGNVEIASALLFDLGVYLVVVAGTILILTELGSLSRREMPRTTADQAE